MNDILHDDDFAFGFSAPLELERKYFDTTSAGEFAGTAAAYGNVDDHGDIITLGAFAGSLREHKARGTTPALLWHHNGARPIGAITEMRDDGLGLQIRGKLNLNTSGGRDAYGHMREGSSRGLSVGYSVEPGGATRNRSGGGRMLSKLKLHEISLTPIPSNYLARVTGVKSLTSAADLERLLREGGLPRRAAEKIAGPGFAALAGDDQPLTETKALDRLADVLREQSVELKSWNTRKVYNGNR